MLESSTAIEFGLLSALRTGNVVFDTLLAIAVPMTIQRLVQLASDYTSKAASNKETLVEMLYKVIFRRSYYVTHSIESVQHRSASGLIEDDANPDRIRSQWLQKALAHYISKHMNLIRQQYGRLELLELKANQDAEITRLEVAALPPLNQWVTLHSQVEFMQEETRHRHAALPEFEEVWTIFHFRTPREQGSKAIHQLIETAFQEYQLLKAHSSGHGNDEDRFLLMRVYAPPSEDDMDSDDEDQDDGKNQDSMVKRCKQYPLSDDTTFRSLFFDGKRELLQLLTDFNDRKGKFQVRGFPYKLGLLLHGPSGSGKTSLIQAIAHYTKRHIVTISLRKITTNAQLMQELFHLKFHVHDDVSGKKMTIAWSFHDILFVIEDVDHIQDVVGARTQRKPPKQRVMDPSERLLRALIHGQASPSNDKLNLSGLLNALDGVLDCPGRMLIMVSEHPEALDPALIRPGRINKTIGLDSMSAQTVVEMLEYSFDTQLSETQRRTIQKCVKKQRMMPSEVATLVSTQSSLEKVLTKL